MKRTRVVFNLVLAALFLALVYVMPFVTMQIPEIGSMLLPMHIPVLLCGFICGEKYGAAVGLIGPVTRSLMLSMPPLFPTAVAMSFELCAYGLLAALFRRILPKHPLYIYPALILAMLGGRIVWAIVSLILYGIQGNEFTFTIMMNGAFLNAIPGIIVQLVIIPPIVMLAERLVKKI